MKMIRFFLYLWNEKFKKIKKNQKNQKFDYLIIESSLTLILVVFALFNELRH